MSFFWSPRTERYWKISKRQIKYRPDLVPLENIKWQRVLIFLQNNVDDLMKNHGEFMNVSMKNIFSDSMQQCVVLLHPKYNQIHWLGSKYVILFYVVLQTRFCKYLKLKFYFFRSMMTKIISDYLFKICALKIFFESIFFCFCPHN